MAAKEEVGNLQVKEAALPPMPKFAKVEEEEFNLDGGVEKEEDEFNLEAGGLQEFMTSIKQTTKPEETKAMRYTTGAPPVAVPSKEKKKTENDYEILGFAQGAGKSGADEFDKLFGDMPAPAAASKPAQAPGVPQQNVQSKPASSAYDQFASYYNTYQQPVARPAPMPAYQYPQPPPPQMTAPPQRPAQAKAPTPFDEAESKYSGLSRSPGGSNELWQ